MPKIYLVGGIGGLTYTKATEWRNEVKRAFVGLAECLDPMRGKDDALEGSESMQDSYEGFLLCQRKAICARDLNDIRRADLTLANFLGVQMISRNSLFELGFAVALSKPIIVVSEPDNFNLCSFVAESAAVVMPFLQEGIEAAKSFLNVGGLR